MKIESLRELISNGENSLVEFMRDDVHPEKLAKVLAGLLNHEGGQLLLGVEDDGKLSGLSREAKKIEKWVMQAALDHLSPSVSPTWEAAEIDGTVIGIVSVPQSAPDRPYKFKQDSSWVTKIRVGTITMDATREEEQRLYQRSGKLRYGLKPVLGSSIDDLDFRRLEDYFMRIRGDSELPRPDSGEWSRLLNNLKLTVEIGSETYPTVDGMLLFGKNVDALLPQSGIRAVCFEGLQQNYNIKKAENIKGPLVGLFERDGTLIRTGVMERAIDFVRGNNQESANLARGRRVQSSDFPEGAVRELIVNALLHRDYSHAGADILLSILDDRLEIQSPGRLPNSVSTENILTGVRNARNQRLVDFMRDYGYVEGIGMGIRRKVIPAMRHHNGTEPEFLEEDFRFTVTLRK